MRSSGRVLLSLVALALIAVAPTEAQQAESTVLTAGEARALAREAAPDNGAARAALEGFLARRDVRDVAARAGIDIVDVESASRVLSDEEVARLAPKLAQAEEALAGGEAIVVSTTAIIIALLVLIIILVA